MTLALVWSVLILAQAVLLYFAFRFFQQRRTTVPILPEFQAPLSELSAALVQLSSDASALKAKADSAVSAQDIADTLAAVQAQADNAKTLAAALAPQNVDPPVIS